jgi:hypothetical protein
MLVAVITPVIRMLYVKTRPFTPRLPRPLRVVHQLQGERSYHIFYQLVRGASAQERQDLALPADPTAFRYLGQSGCTVGGQGERDVVWPQDP